MRRVRPWGSAEVEVEPGEGAHWGAQALPLLRGLQDGGLNSHLHLSLAWLEGLTSLAH